MAKKMGIEFLGIGFQPKWGLKDIPIMPKVNHYFSSELDMIQKFHAGLALQLIATTVFANSPFTKGKPNGYLSMRSHIWIDTDNNPAGMLPFIFDDSFGELLNLSFSRPVVLLLHAIVYEYRPKNIKSLNPSLQNGSLLDVEKSCKNLITTVGMVLDIIKDVEVAVSRCMGRTGTAAGDVAFPKGKENLASVLKCYKRRLLNKFPGS